uniref:Uncharacterized protein n=1 Tax=Arundo donax TaxID=35708 RepID=A0A0A9CQL9_ARUDO
MDPTSTKDGKHRGLILKLVVGHRKLDTTSTMNVRRKCSSADFICLRDFSMLVMEGEYPFVTPNLSNMKVMLPASMQYLTSPPLLGIPSILCTLSLVIGILPRPLITNSQ